MKSLRQLPFKLYLNRRGRKLFYSSEIMSKEINKAFDKELGRSTLFKLVTVIACRY